MTESYVLYHGRPEDADERLPKEKRTYDLLDSLGIAYDRVDHPEADTMEACAKVEEALGCEICKNLFLCNRQKTAFYLLLLKGNKPFKTKDVSKELGVSRLSFADADDMEKYLDITPGSVSVLGLMNDKDRAVTLLFDRDLLRDESIGCHPCINTSSLKIKTADLVSVFLTHIGHPYTAVRIASAEEQSESSL